MRRLSFVLFVAPASALAADPFACVDPDAAEAFLGNWYQEPSTYSTTIPAEFPDAVLPAPFELIGSSTSETTTFVVYKSETDTREALAEAEAALEPAGWLDRSEFNTAQYGGFQVREKAVGTVLCRDSRAASMSIMVKEGTASTYLSLMTHNQPYAQICGDDGARLRTDRRGPELRKYLPVLQLPVDAKASRVGSGGGGDEYSARVVVSSPMSRSDLMTHFDQEIRRQEWLPDGGWTGSTSSGSVWTKTDEDGMGMVGVLRIADAATGVYNVRFTVSSINPEKHFSGSSSTSN